MKTDKFDNSNPFLWVLIFAFFLFWAMQWVG